MIGTAGCLYADHAGSELRDGLQKLRTLNASPQDDLTELVDPVKLEHVLRQINATALKAIAVSAQ